MSLNSGRGSFGVVHEASVLNKKVALKILHRNADLNHKQQVFKSYLAEQNIKNLRHKNLITYFGCNNVDNEHDVAFIIYEFGGKYNLNQVILDGKVELTQSRRKSFSLDLVNALEYIHLNNIVHMDLKPANIIVTDGLVLKLTDFGCSVKIDTTASCNNNNNNSSRNYNLNYNNEQRDPPINNTVNSRWTAGTWFYRAPELFRNDSLPISANSSNVTTSCDIFSLGICMWQLLTRDSPYRGENPHVIIYQIVSKGIRPEYPDLKSINEVQPRCIDVNSEKSSILHGCSVKNGQSSNDFEQLYRLIVEKSWDSDPSRRFTAKHIKELLTNNFVCK